VGPIPNRRRRPHDGIWPVSIPVLADALHPYFLGDMRRVPKSIRDSFPFTCFRDTAMLNVINNSAMSDDSRNSDIAPILMLAARTQMAAMTAGLETLGFKEITPTLAILMPLVDAEGTRSSVLAQRAGVTKQAMSQFVKRLEERGYVEHSADPSETGAKVIRPTKRGVALSQACAQVRQDLQKDLLKVLGERDLAGLTQNLQKLVASMPASRKPSSACPPLDSVRIS
jgi:DNA-binding MarR family transcriptional regulator